MPKEKFERTKPHVNVGTIGHVDHGKTTLLQAYVAPEGTFERSADVFVFFSTGRLGAEIHKALEKMIDEVLEAKKAPRPAIGAVFRRKSGATAIKTARAEDDPTGELFVNVDPPSDAGLVNIMITGATRSDVSTLVVSTPDDGMSRLREHIPWDLTSNMPPVALRDEYDALGEDVPLRFGFGFKSPGDQTSRLYELPSDAPPLVYDFGVGCVNHAFAEYELLGDRVPLPYACDSESVEDQNCQTGMYGVLLGVDRRVGSVSGWRSRRGYWSTWRRFRSTETCKCSGSREKHSVPFQFADSSHGVSRGGGRTSHTALRRPTSATLFSDDGCDSPGRNCTSTTLPREGASALLLPHDECDGPDGGRSRGMSRSAGRGGD